MVLTVPQTPCFFPLFHFPKDFKENRSTMGNHSFFQGLGSLGHIYHQSIQKLLAHLSQRLHALHFVEMRSGKLLNPRRLDHVDDRPCDVHPSVVLEACKQNFHQQPKKTAKSQNISEFALASPSALALVCICFYLFPEDTWAVDHIVDRARTTVTKQHRDHRCFSLTIVFLCLSSPTDN